MAGTAFLVSGSVEFFVGITSLDPSDVYLSAKVLYPEPRVMEILEVPGLFCPLPRQ